MTCRKICISVFCAILFCSPYPGMAMEDNLPSEKEGFISGTFLFPIRFFQNHISGADGDRCAMHPSCSTYAVDAFKRHGFFMGWIMTCDRLMRCGRDDVVYTPPVWKNNTAYSYDPVENNNFWWNQGK